MAYLKAFGANTVDVDSVYVAISGAGKGAAVYNDNRASLAETFGIRNPSKST